VFNLRCEQGHGFEGWFSSEDDYLSQTARGLLNCPICDSAKVERLPSAPRLNLGEHRAPREASPSATETAAAPQSPEGGAVAALQAQYLQMVRQVLAHTEDVGEKFPEEVRRIHYGESEHRNIRGQADAEQREALREEGIEVFSLPIPQSLKGPLQ
jgi:hypothetical protein